MADKYLIVSPGRTGSHLIFSYFQRHHIDSIVIDEYNQFNRLYHKDIFCKSDYFVVHYHGKTFLAEDLHNWTVIMNYRKDLFDQYCSYIIAEKTDQWTLYDKIKKFPKISLDMEDMIDKTLEWVEHRKTVERLMIRDRPWKKTIDIYYEQIIPDDRLLFELVPLSGCYDADMYTGSEKSPYDKKKVISNYEANRFKYYKWAKNYGISEPGLDQ